MMVELVDRNGCFTEHPMKNKITNASRYFLID